MSVNPSEKGSFNATKRQAPSAKRQALSQPYFLYPASAKWLSYKLSSSLKTDAFRATGQSSPRIFYEEARHG